MKELKKIWRLSQIIFIRMKEYSFFQKSCGKDLRKMNKRCFLRDFLERQVKTKRNIRHNTSGMWVCSLPLMTFLAHFIYITFKHVKLSNCMRELYILVKKNICFLKF